jgi:hypothetical protein
MKDRVEINTSLDLILRNPHHNKQQRPSAPLMIQERTVNTERQEVWKMI